MGADLQVAVVHGVISRDHADEVIGWATQIDALGTAIQKQAHKY